MKLGREILNKKMIYMKSLEIFVLYTGATALLQIHVNYGIHKQAVKGGQLSTFSYPSPVGESTRDPSCQISLPLTLEKIMTLE